VARATPWTAPLLLPLAQAQWTVSADAIAMLNIAQASLPPQRYAALATYLLAPAYGNLTIAAARLYNHLRAFAEGNIDGAAFYEAYNDSLQDWMRSNYPREELGLGGYALWGLGAVLTNRQVRMFPTSPSTGTLFSPSIVSVQIVRTMADLAERTGSGVYESYDERVTPGSGTMTMTASMIRQLLPALP
jgi:hypothetical protein